MSSSPQLRLPEHDAKDMPVALDVVRVVVGVEACVIICWTLDAAVGIDVDDGEPRFIDAAAAGQPAPTKVKSSK